jgi:hypothetical protein
MSAVYQVTARRPGSSARSVTLAGKPLHFGSGVNADLPLAGADIPAVAGRLFVGGGDQVMLFNLGSALTLDGVPVPELEPTIWKPGGRLGLGVYTLELSAVTAAPGMNTDETPLEVQPLMDLPTVQPNSVKPQAPMPAPVSQMAVPTLPPEIQSYTSRRLPVPSPAQRVGDDLDTLIGPLRKMGNRQWSGYSDDHRVTQAAPVIVENDSPEDREGFTRFKNWLEQDKLSAQLGLKAINFAPGERIVLPLSVHNGYSHPLELAMSVAGIPDDWAIADAPVLALAAGELKGFEVIINTRSAGEARHLDAVLKLYDRVTPEIYIHLPLPITLKNQPDVTGGFDQPQPRVPGRVYLSLQNHTLSTIKVTLSIGQHDPALRVVLPEPEIELIPHQKLRAPVDVDAVRRPPLISRRATLHINAQQGIRAPIDLATSVFIQPSFSLLPLFALAIGLFGLGLLLLAVARMNGAAMILPTATMTATPSPTLTMTTRPSATATATMTATTTPTMIPSVTPLPFVDPRPADCQASVPIPYGWMPYQVAGGENLFRIARRFNVSQTELATVNCIQDVTYIQEGQWILAPSGQ